MNFNNIIIDRKLREYLEEDCNFEDISSAVIPENSTTNAKVISKSEGYISGLEELGRLCRILGIDIKNIKKDGDHVISGEIIAELNGNTRNILQGERIALNLMTHMSAITTTTRMYQDAISEVSKKTRIACTRKTLPGLRIFEKKAVSIGGGDMHRFSLDDMILLKDTHLKFYDGDVKRLLVDAKNYASFSKKIEIEIEKVEDVLLAARYADIVMLDNMNINRVEKAFNLLHQENLRNKVLIEISGDINLGNIRRYAKFEPDIISTSQLTLFPNYRLDLSLKFDD